MTAYVVVALTSLPLLPKTLLINPTVEPDPLQVLHTTSSSNPEYVTHKDAHDAGPLTSNNEVDELSTEHATRSPITRPTEPPTNGRATIETPTTATSTGILRPKLSLDAKPTFKGKKTRFDGVLITTKSPSYQILRSSRPGSVSAPASSSRLRQLSLVDALACTFDANRHTEGPARRHPRLYRDDDGSATPGPQTDVDTEAEDEKLQLNTRLARSPLKKLYPRTRAILSENVSDHNSEDGASLLPPRDAERPVKRLKPISYDANAALVDAALGTVEATIGWDAELDFITKEDDEFTLPMTPVTRWVPTDAHGMEDMQLLVDDGANEPTSGPTAGKTLLSSTPVAANQRHGPICVPPRPRRMLLPYLSRGAKFIQRLDTIYGENATVRTDKAARPTSVSASFRLAPEDSRIHDPVAHIRTYRNQVDLEFYAPFDEPDDNYGESSPSPSESVSVASALEEGASAAPSTHVTSQSPSDVPATDMVADDMNLEPLSRNQLGEVVTGITQPSSDISEETIGGWIIALQRLVKGKIRIKEEDLETVSIILAEIESLKDNLNENASTTSELRESVKQLSELHEIPFGDRNKLRQRAKVIYHAWPSMKELGAS
ncbi:hypothetical protein JVU11DRAFT_1291 [Chiua virens]|nr:hypothetical protein JVU11DRAFT_1291 [Chiua virens]